MSSKRDDFGAVPTDPACSDTRSGVGKKWQHSTLSIGTVRRIGTAEVQVEQDSALVAGVIGQGSSIAAGNAVEGRPTNMVRRMTMIRFKAASPLVPSTRSNSTLCIPRTRHYAPAGSRHQPFAIETMVADFHLLK